MRASAQHAALITACVALWCSTPAPAQQGPTLIRQGIEAYNDFNSARALPLLRRGVDPKAGPRDSLWALGVQYLAQILYEQRDEAGARAWIRWAVRLVPDFKLDTLNLVSPVIAAFRSARAVTSAGPDEARAVTEWIWPSADPGTGPGRLELQPNGTPVSLIATVANGGALNPAVSLPAGSYPIEARAPGYLPAHVTREVLPGITTVIRFSLLHEPTLVATPEAPTPKPPPPPVAVVPQKKKGHFPWVVVLGGLAVAGGVAALAGGSGGHGGGGTSTPPGSITISFPDPP